jgi:plasmid stabilization system protein ParE
VLAGKCFVDLKLRVGSAGKNLNRSAVRIREVIARLADCPKGRQPVVERPGVHVVPLVRYPYRIFYRIGDDRIRILHIRNTAREVWGSDSR